MGKDETLNLGEKGYCSGCGNCCRLGGANYDELKRDDGSQACKYFQEPDICTIYAERPWFCRNDKMAIYGTKTGAVVSERHYRDVSERACKRIEVIPPEKITLEEFTRIGKEEIFRDR